MNLDETFSEGRPSVEEGPRLGPDELRNEANLELLRRYAPGSRVLHVGAGVGLLACVAARLGAKEVFAVEPRPTWQEAARLVRENGLDAIVEVIPERIEDIAPREVDFGFADIAPADPFSRGLLDGMDAARRWVRSGGHLAPQRVRMWVALARAADRAKDARTTVERLRRIGAHFDLCIATLEGLVTANGCRVVRPEDPVSEPVLVCDLPIGRRLRPENVVVDLVAPEPMTVGGAVLWFEAQLDGDLVFSNAPGQPGPRGRLVSAWGRDLALEAGQRLSVRVRFSDGRASVELA